MTGKLLNIGRHLLLIVFGLLVLFPLLLAINNSFKSQEQMFKSAIALPNPIVFENYVYVFSKLSFLNIFINTVIIVLLSIFGIIFLSSIAGYWLSRNPGKVSSIVFFTFISSMLIPFQSIMISLLKILKITGLSGSKLGLIMTYWGLGMSMAVFLYHGFVKAIPHSLEESAYIDGCGPLRTFIKIVFPLLVPITSTVIIFDFLWIWNDFLLPLLVLDDVKSYTLVLMANSFRDKYNNEWNYILAVLVLTSLPVVLMYSVFQKYIIEGITAGAIKG